VKRDWALACCALQLAEVARKLLTRGGRAPTCGSHAAKRGLIGGGRRPPGSFMYSLGLKNFLVSLVVRHLQADQRRTRGHLEPQGPAARGRWPHRAARSARLAGSAGCRCPAYHENRRKTMRATTP
jgi:hypothetical protein